MSGPEMVGRYVTARYGYGGGSPGEGRVISYTDAPTFTIERQDGSRFSWRADMVIPADPPHGPALGDRVWATWRGERAEFVWAEHSTCDRPGWVRADAQDCCVADAELTDIAPALDDGPPGMSVADFAARVAEIAREFGEAQR